MCLREQKKSVRFLKKSGLSQKTNRRIAGISPVATQDRLCTTPVQSIECANSCASGSLFQYICSTTCAVCLIAVFAHQVYWCSAICTVDPDTLLCYIVSRRIECKTEGSVTGWGEGCAAVYHPDHDWSYREGQGLHTRVNLCPPSGSNSPPAGRIVSSQLPWGGAHASLLVARPLIWGGCEPLTHWALAPLWISGLQAGCCCP